MNKKLIKRIVPLIPVAAAEVALIILLFTVLAPLAIPLDILMRVFAVLYILYIMNKEGEGIYRMLWMLIILTVPLFGTLLYLFFGDKRTGRPLEANILRSRDDLPYLDPMCGALCIGKYGDDLRAMQTISMVEKMSRFPVHTNPGADYYPLGDDAFKPMLAALETAQKYIFIEYFIMERGLLWDSIVEILTRKVQQGVDVRVMYDDLGSIATYTRADRAALQALGIKCIAFNPVVLVRGTLNYRSHRKMMVIDGRIAFSGGINMADEYINQNKHPYGHWKDLVYAVRGGAVENFVHMFAEFWNGFSDDKIDPAKLDVPYTESEDCDGLALSYYDSPVGVYNVTYDLYADLLETATDYVWFYTPYLRLGDALQEAMIKAARRGVDVRIIMPGIPDKKVIFRMARAYYPQLLAAGVRIFEYTPGFMHAKACMMDDKFCAMGTVNLDYRSLFLNFENNTLFYRSSILQDLKADYEHTLTMCREVKYADLRKGVITWMIDSFLRIISPAF